MMKKVIVISIISLFISLQIKAQTVEITSMDEIDWENPSELLQNSSFYLLNGKGNVALTGTYRKGKKDGTFLYFYGKGLYKEENYKRGVLSGFWLEFIPHGSQKGFYRKGKKEGIWILTKDSQYEETEYKNDVLDGHYKYANYDADSVVIGHYKKGKKTGIWIHYNNKQEEIYREIFKEGKMLEKQYVLENSFSR